MTVSVIIPSYNHSKYLRQRIDSVLNQTYRDFELIILDDASTDNSREIISSYLIDNPDIRVYYNDENSGNPYMQWNNGVSLARGEYVWIAESDDYAESTFLEKTVNFIGKYESTGLVFTDSVILDEEKQFRYRNSTRNSFRPVSGKVTIESLVNNCIPNVSSVLFRKAAYFRSGMAVTSMRFCADWFLYLKIKQNWDIIYLPEALNTYRLHEDSGYHLHYSSNKFLKEKLRIYVWLLRRTSLKARILYKISWGIIKSLGLRIMHMVHMPSFMIPEIPRVPRKLVSISEY